MSTNHTRLVGRANRSIRSIYAYDQFTTTGFFDVLWIDHTVIAAVNALHAPIHTQHNCSCNDLFIADPARIDFIVLGSYEAALFSRYGGWALSLEINGKRLEEPIIRAIQLPIEYRRIFGNRYNQFKTAYWVQFVLPVPLEWTNNDRVFKLMFRSAEQEQSVVWKNKKEQRYEDCHRC